MSANEEPEDEDPPIAIPLADFAAAMKCSAELADIDQYLAALNEGFGLNPGRQNAPAVIIREGQFIYCSQITWENLKRAATLDPEMLEAKVRLINLRERIKHGSSTH